MLSAGPVRVVSDLPDPASENSDTDRRNYSNGDLNSVSKRTS